ncbi:MAG: carboxy terminal-processing peptidase [Methylacidiphilales bacterium]|nr:carboxy terminal-processing peptidase [Candidatus Methylacidiphilales bacterium]
MGQKSRLLGFFLCFALLTPVAYGFGARPGQQSPPAPQQGQGQSPATNTSGQTPAVDKAAEYQDEVFGRAAALVSRFLQEQHFARHPIDAVVSAEWIKAYMKALDYNRLFFLKGEQDDFEAKYAPDAGSEIRSGQLSPAFAIFKVFQQHVNSRLAWVNKRLSQPFDFTTQDYYEPDRSKADWPQTAAEEDALWERRLKYEILQDRLAEKRKPQDSIQHLQKRYGVLQKNLNETDHEDIVTTYLSALTTLYDPHSVYLGPKEEEDFDISMKLQLVGIGAVLSSEDGYCIIKEIIPGGPADLDKRLTPNDKIVGVAQGDKEYIDIVDMKLRNAVHLIRGDKGTVVRLKVIPGGSDHSAVREEVRLVRDQVKIASQKAKAKVISQIGPDGQEYKIGVIELPSFYGNIGDYAGEDPSGGSSTTDDVALLIKKLKEKNIDGLVLDLRNNGGGLLSEAVRLVGLFIGKGPVVQVKDSQGKKQVLQNFDSNMAYDGPLMVLTNKLSASASEIAAGALQNYGRALIVGDKSTHGKGTVQTVAELNHFIPPINGITPVAGAMKITIQKFYLPNGHSTQQRGVIPDIILPSPNDYLELGESNLPHSLPWDEIEPAPFTKLDIDNPTGFIPQLNADSQQRIAKDGDFKLLLDDIARLRKHMEDRRVSLNITQRETEAAEDKQRKDEREKILKAMSAKLPDILSISFDNKKGLVEQLASQEKPKPKPAPDTSGDDEGTDIPKLTTSESYAADLHLRESLRIFGDWLKLLDKKGTMTALGDTKPKS